MGRMNYLGVPNSWTVERVSTGRSSGNVCWDCGRFVFGCRGCCGFSLVVEPKPKLLETVEKLSTGRANDDHRTRTMLQGSPTTYLDLRPKSGGNHAVAQCFAAMPGSSSQQFFGDNAGFCVNVRCVRNADFGMDCRANHNGTRFQRLACRGYVYRLKGEIMPRVEVKAEMHWDVWPLKPGKFCSGCKKRLGESAVMVTVLFPGLDPMPAKKYCQSCFNSMRRFWEKHLLIQPVEVASTGKTRRIDSEGRDVTDLPGLWSESDKDIPQ